MDNRPTFWQRLLSGVSAVTVAMGMISFPAVIHAEEPIEPVPAPKEFDIILPVYEADREGHSTGVSLFWVGTEYIDSYYSQLNDVGMEVYDRLYEGFKDGDVEKAYAGDIVIDGVAWDGYAGKWIFTDDGSECDLNKYLQECVDFYYSEYAFPAFAALCDDHCELSWLSASKGSSGELGDPFVGEDYISVEAYIVPDYAVKAGDPGAMSAKIESIKKEIGNPGDRYDTVKAIHDYLANTIDYNHPAADKKDTTYTADEKWYFQTAYSAFYPLAGKDTELKTVCAGYAKAFKVLCDAYGIPCAHISGVSGGVDHAWSYVQMEDGKWYAVDVTYDDQTEKIGRIFYDYFLKGSTSFKKDHTEVSEDGFAYPILSVKDYVRHVHAFSDKWSNDKSEHWHECECGAKADTAAHTFGKWQHDDSEHWRTCTVCGYIDKAEHTQRPNSWLINNNEHTHSSICLECGFPYNSEKHIPGEWTTLKAATCSKEGEKVRYCTKCGEIAESEAIPMTEHTFSRWQKDDTSHWRKCINCGYTTEKAAHVPDESSLISGSEVHWNPCTICDGECNAQPHNFVFDGVVREATCQSEGRAMYVCECGLAENRVIPIDPNNHDGGTVIRNKKAATCTEEGYTGDTYCLGCEKLIEEGKVIPANGHSYGNKWKSDGKEHWQVCTVCEKESEHTAHTPKNKWYYELKYHYLVCEVCDANYDAAPHEFGELTVIKPATCAEEGVGSGVCKVCKMKDLEIPIPIDPNNHIGFSEDWSYNSAKHWHSCLNPECDGKSDEGAHTFKWVIDKEATETAAGSKHEECEICGYKKAAVEIPKLDHVHTGIERHKGTASTCCETGTAEYWTCSSPKCKGKYYGDKDCQTLLETIELPLDPDNHVGGTEVKNKKAATCSEEGYTGDTYCKGCGELLEKGKAIEKTAHTFGKEWKSDKTGHWNVCDNCGEKSELREHTFKWVVDKAATEDEVGSKHEECTVCGYKKAAVEIPKLEHVHTGIEHHKGTASTCCETGTAEYWTCSSDKCKGKYYGDKDCQTLLETLELPLDPDNHAGGTEVRNKKAAACTEEGYTGDTYCLGCEKLLEEGKAIDKLPHSYPEKWVSDESGHWHECESCGGKSEIKAHTFKWVVDKAATEDEVGSKHEECEICGYKKAAVEIPKLDHVHTGIERHKGTASTCCETGTAEYWTCSSPKCKGKYYGDKDCQTLLDTIDLPLDPDNHAGGTEVRNKKAAACTEEGYTGDTYCLGCEKLLEEGKAIPASGHKTGDWVSDGESHWKTCSVCGEIIDKHAHDFGEWETIKTATCCEKGEKRRFCSVCDYSELADIEKDANNHVGGTKIVGRKLATCLNEGYTGDEVCLGCGEVITKGEVIEKLDHSYSKAWKKSDTEHWHECTVCGEKTDIAPHSFPDKWKNNSTYHWHECECGYKADKAKHEWVLDEEKSTDTLKVYVCLCGRSYEEETVPDKPDVPDKPETPKVASGIGGVLPPSVCEITYVGFDKSVKVAQGAVPEKFTPAKEGFTFAGWYIDEALTQRFDPTAPVMSSRKLYAKWVASTGEDITPAAGCEMSDETLA